MHVYEYAAIWRKRCFSSIDATVENDRLEAFKNDFKESYADK